MDVERALRTAEKIFFVVNEILGIASIVMVKKIVAEANESFLSVAADESCNISEKRTTDDYFKIYQS